MWTDHLELLLSRVADTFSHVLGSESVCDRDRGQLTIKICLQIFQAVPESIGAMVWRGEHGKKDLQRIVGFLFQVVMGRSSYMESRLLASTALVKLINSTSQAQLSAGAALCAIQLTQEEVEDMTLGELKVTVPALGTDGLGSLLMCRGLVTCSKEACVLLDLLFPVIATYCGERKNRNQSRVYQVLSLWLKYTKENIAEIWRLREGRLLGEHSIFTYRLMELMWNRTESPVEGVLESVHCSFRLLVDIYRLECSHFEDPEQPLYSTLLQRLRVLPWQVKAKYYLLSSLVSCFGAKKVLDGYEELPKHLLNCLSTNHLSPAASDLYRAILGQHRMECTSTQGALSEQELAESWAQPWLEILAEALTSDLPLLQQNAANYLLVWTLRIFPASFLVLSRAFDGHRPGHRLAWTTLLSVQQANSGVLPMDDDTVSKIRASLHCLDDRVRLRALALLCISPKTNQPLSSRALSLLKEFLPLNMNCDSSSFRQFLQASVKKALVRIRDSCLLHLRAQRRRSHSNQKGGEGTPGPEAIVSQGVGFIQWVLELSVTSLLPGLNYQRKKTALLLMEALLETCTDSWSPHRRKGQPPRDMAELLSLARQRGCWDFFSQSNLLVLLGCLMDGTNEIRELAAKLLVRYLQLPLPRPLSAGLLEQALRMVCSPRVMQAEAGALMMKTALQKSDVSVLQRVVAQEEATVEAWSQPLNFVAYLHQLLEEQYSVARADLLLAAGTKPMHGLIMALRKCLTEVPETLSSLRQLPLTTRWQRFIGQLMGTVDSISHFLLDILSGAQPSCSERQDAAPSFADMGIAIKAVIAVGKGLEQDDGEDSVLLTEDHSLILTCCWVTVREVGLLLGYLVELALMARSRGDSSRLISVTHIQNIAGVFQNILLKCRHWGAVEGCSAGFTRFCATLLKQESPELQAIPREILDQGLSVLKGPRSSSITRRAAGLPMLMLCVVAGEESSESRPLLHYCMKTLLDIASAPLPNDWDQTVDLPQVCAVHTLQTLTQDSVLGSAVLTYSSNMASLSLQGLSSASWAMRNAAIQLLSALTSRMLGQKRSGDDSAQSGMTPRAFFMHYPELEGLLLNQLQCATSQDSAPEGGHLHLVPSLHSILTLLAKLQPNADGTHRSFSSFLRPLTLLAANPIHSVRVMCAKALVALVPLSECSTVLSALIGALPPHGAPISHNTLHGRLLQVGALLGVGLESGCFTPQDLQDLVERLEAKLWLMSPAQRCPLIRAAYLQIVSFVVNLCSQDFLCQLQGVLLAELDASPSRLMIGCGILRRAVTHFLCTETVRAAQGGPGPLDRIGKLLLSDDVEVRAAVLTWIRESQGCMDGQVGPWILRHLLNNLRRALLEEDLSVEYKRNWLEAIVLLQDDPRGLEWMALPGGQGQAVGCTEILLSEMKVAKYGPDLQCHALCAVSVLLVGSCQILPLALLERWVTVLEQCSDPTSTDVLRLGAAASLVRAGVRVVEWALTAPLDRVSLVVRLINAGICLLQDEDQRVRTQAAKFATRIHLLSKGSDGELIHLQSNKGLLSLLKFLLQNCWQCKETFEILMLHVPAPDMPGILVELESEEALNLYEEDGPNVFAESGAFARLLLPFLLRIVDKLGSTTAYHSQLMGWAADNQPDIVRNVEHLKQSWSQGLSVAGCFGLLAAAKLFPSLVALLVRSAVLFHLLQTLESHQVDTSNCAGPSHKLKSDLELLNGLMSQNGLIPASLGAEFAIWMNPVTER
ncbi:tRNA (32-2'-O)-methyltransferase regulator THADA isoform X2 [Heptranchias perlo]|uniref:tRNA (32-2'-O)-methyltransferase regulator THADA isoform X2 n=1 Tax=Heptranchias perlo TaxID=212740 RepID=UPI0035599509